MTYLPATLFVAPAVANRRWLKSLGPELEALVREQSRQAEANPKVEDDYEALLSAAKR